MENIILISILDFLSKEKEKPNRANYNHLSLKFIDYKNKKYPKTRTGKNQ